MRRFHEVSEQTVAALSDARSIVGFSGASISAKSGVSTCNGKLPGCWAPPDLRSLETATALTENTQIVWAQLYAAHLVLQRVGNLGRMISIITQNIDDLQERAGSEEVIHLHGRLYTARCFACNRPTGVKLDQLGPEGGSLFEALRCDRYYRTLSPSVVWYGEDLPTGAWRSPLALVKNCDVLTLVCKSGKVIPAAGLPKVALSLGATVINVNIADVGTDEPNAIMLIGKASEILPQAYTSMQSERCRP